MASHTTNHIVDILDRMIQQPGFQRQGNEAHRECRQASILYDDVTSGKTVIVEPSKTSS